MNIVVIIGIILIIWFTMGIIFSYRQEKKQKEQEKLLTKTRKSRGKRGYFAMNENVKSKKQRKPNKKSQNITPKHKNDPTKSIPGSGQQEIKKEKPFRGVKPKGNKKKDAKNQNKVKERPTSAVKPKKSKKNKNKKRYYYKNKKKKANNKKQQPIK